MDKPIIEDFGNGYQFFCPICGCELDGIRTKSVFPEAYICPECTYFYLEGDEDGKNKNTDTVR